MPIPYTAPPSCQILVMLANAALIRAGAEPQVKGYSQSCHKAFATQDAATAFVESWQQAHEIRRTVNMRPRRLALGSKVSTNTEKESTAQRGDDLAVRMSTLDLTAGGSAS